jgi:hypothetical protein
VNNIKMDLGEIGWGGIKWISVAQDRDKWRALANCCNEPWGYIECWEFSGWLASGVVLVSVE